MNRALLVLLLFILAGCAVKPGGINVGVSSFDGADETALEPAPLCDASSGRACLVRLGLYRRSTMAEGSVILIAVAASSNPIADGESLSFRLNGRDFPLSSIDRNTRYGIGQGPHTAGIASCWPAGCSAKRYLVDKAFLKSLIDTPDASCRIVLQNGFLAGTLGDGDPKLALPSFRRFYARVFGP
jgi:hypothetical protein